MTKVTLNGFTGDVSVFTVRNRITFRGIYSTLLDLRNDIAAELKEDPDAIGQAMYDYAMVCARVTQQKGSLDFSIVSSTDDGNKVREAFMTYLNSKHYDVIVQIEQAIIALDAPHTPPEQQPDAELTDPN